MKSEGQLRVIKVSFSLKEGQEIDRQELTEDQYERFCNDFELSRLRFNVKWPEFDGRYVKKAGKT